MLVKYVASAVERFPDANSDTCFELTVPTRQHMIDYLVLDQEMVKNPFKFAALAHRIQIKFFKQCVGKALHNLEADETDDDPFGLYN